MFQSIKLIKVLLVVAVILGGVNLLAQNGTGEPDLDPVISAKLTSKYQSIYDRAAENQTTQRWLIGQRMELLADPLNLKVHKTLRSSKLAEKYLPEAMDQVRAFIWESNIGHQDSGTLAIPGAGGQLQDFLKQVQEVASVFPFTKTARDSALIFSLPGKVNAYTWSGSVANISAAFFDPLRDKMDRGNMNQIIGHELTHILFGHIPDQILLSLIFYATAKNEIPPQPDESEDVKDPKNSERAKKDQKSLALAREALLDSALDVLVRQLIPHAGSEVDDNPAFRAGMKRILKATGDRIAATESRESLLSLSAQLVRSVRNLPANAEVEISKEAEKQFREDLDRFSRSCETSCDRAGYIANRLLSEDREKAHETSVMAYVKLVGSKDATYAGTLEQIRRLYEQTLDPETRARFRDVGSSHPNTYARAAQFSIFRRSEAARVLSDPFLTALTDYIELTKFIVALEARELSPAIRELYDRVSDSVNRDAVIEMAKNLSDWIQDVVIEELRKVHEGKSKDVSATVLLLETLKNVVGDGGNLGALPSLVDLRDELGKPKRLFADLISKLRALDGETLAAISSSGIGETLTSKNPLPLGTTILASGNPLVLAEVGRTLGFRSDGAEGKTLYRLVIDAIGARMPMSEIASDAREIISKAAGCAEAVKAANKAAKGA